MEDEILIKYLRKNDRKAYSILFDKYFERLFTFAVRVVFREDVANDIVQEIFISLYEKSEILNYDLSLKSYLFNSVRNRCFNYLRDRKVEDRRMNLYAEACLWSDNVDWIEEEEVLRKIQEVMLELPEKCREVCRRGFFEGKKFEEIAEELDISESTARVQTHRAACAVSLKSYLDDMIVRVFHEFDISAVSLKYRSYLLKRFLNLLFHFFTPFL